MPFGHSNAAALFWQKEWHEDGHSAYRRNPFSIVIQPNRRHIVDATLL